MLGTDNGAGLVAGASPAADRTERVRVVRAFLLGGERQEVGTELDLHWRLATELRTVGKVERVEPADEPKPKKAKAKDGEP